MLAKTQTSRSDELGQAIKDLDDPTNRAEGLVVALALAIHGRCIGGLDQKQTDHALEILSYTAINAVLEIREIVDRGHEALQFNRNAGANNA